MPKPTSGTTLSRKDWLGAIGLLLLMALTILMILGALYLWGNYRCKNRGEIMMRDYRYSAVSGCYVAGPTGGWAPTDNVLLWLNQ